MRARCGDFCIDQEGRRVGRAVVFVLTTIAAAVTARPAVAAEQISNRGPGMKRRATEPLKLPVARTFDLTHVEPEHFAVALGKDPARIFEFVRDKIGYEAYSGSLRGPRGTLLAMAGNSVDRAALLASLLEQSGQRVRYRRGTLPDREAGILVTSMWADRPVPPAAPRGKTSPTAKTSVDALLPTAERDFSLLREQLRTLKPADLDEGPTPDALLKEARQHYWVQRLVNGSWTDLDPSFADSTPGQTFAVGNETLDTLPEKLFHRVTLRVQVEEQTADKASVRNVLTYSAKAAELSALDVALAHVPENWKGTSASAIAVAMEDTSRVKAALLIGDRLEYGKPFSRTIPAGGLGGVASILGGGTTGATVPVATSETLEIELTAPDGRKELVSREIFDLVGKALRSAGKTLTADEVRAKTEASPDLTQNVYSLFFTTGGVDAIHLLDLSVPKADGAGQPVDVLMGLRRFSILFAAVSDGLLWRLRGPDQTMIRFYPDSPRITIAELTSRSGRQRLALDLRRDHARAVVQGPRREFVALARLYRGVLAGTLERMIMDYVAADLRAADGKLQGTMSTSALFELASSERVPIVILPRDEARLEADVPRDTRARLRQEAASGHVLIAPRRTIAVDGNKRFAWWRINHRTGETVAVTDEGLHQVVVEYRVQHSRTGQVQMWFRQRINGVAGDFRRTPWFNPGDPAWQAIVNDFTRIMQGAVNLGARGLY